MDLRLDGKTTLITGAASGIGRGIAESYARAGAAVVIADIAADAAEDAAQALRKAGHKAIAVRMDVTDAAQVDAGCAAAAEQFGRLDVMIANAGIQIVAPVHELPLADWRRMLAIHLDGAFLCTQSAMRRMIADGGGGAILYMGSVHSKTASPLKAPYVTAKHGLLGLARVVAIEGARHGIRSHVICPGFVRTPLVDKQIPEQAQELGISEEAVVRDVMLKHTVDSEFTTVEDIARVALFLAAFPSAALTGQSVIASHGWHME